MQLCTESLFSTINSWLLYLYNTNSPIILAAIGSFFGAFGGYAIVTLLDRRTKLFAQVSAIKSAIAITHDIFNVMISLKKQHINDLLNLYNNKREGFLESLENSPAEPRVTHILFDKRVVSFPFIDFDLVTKKVLELPDLPLRALIIASTMIRTLNALKQLLNARQDSIMEIQQLARQMSLDAFQVAHLYYGLPIEVNGQQIQYETHNDIMENISCFCNDTVWFSKELATELINVGNKVARKIYFRRPSVGSVDYSEVPQTLLPDDKDYQDWREKFKMASK